MIDTVYLHMEFKSKKGNWSINLPFLCTKCGVCCTLDDFLMAGEIKAKPETHPEVHAKMESLKKELGKKFDEGEEIYEWYVTHTMCPFQVDNTCSIYEIRPDGCRQFPNTPFGMLSQDCEALNRFKKQRSALKKGRAAKETYHFTTDEPVEPTKCAEEQYQKCVAKLRQAGITDDELALFNCFNTNWNSNLTSNGVEKKKSQINGLGIFATKDFKKGELVIRWSAYKELRGVHNFKSS